MTVREIAQATRGQFIGTGDLEIIIMKEVVHITQDSREIQENSLFVPILGERVDGHDFILDSFEKGAVICFSEKVITPPEGKGIILVENVKTALLQLAGYYKNKFKIPFVAITGSVGKTTTKDMIASVLSQKYNTLYTQGNYNNEIGVPLTLFRLEDIHEVAVIEMGMNHSGEIHALAEIVRPDIGVISNVGVAHIEYLGSRKEILKAKCELLHFMGKENIVVLNGDDDMLSTLENRITPKISWFGMENQKDIYANHLEPRGIEETKCDIHTPKGMFSVVVPVAGNHMVANALSAVAVGIALDMTLEDIKKGIETFVPSKNRMNIINLSNGITILNDVYNANPVSTKASLDILARAEGRKVAILGFMGELGSFALEMHKEVGAYVAQKKIDILLYVGQCGSEVEAGAKEQGLKEVYCFATQEELWEKALDKIQKNDTVLVKASRSMKLEKTVEKMQGVN